MQLSSRLCSHRGTTIQHSYLKTKIGRTFIFWCLTLKIILFIMSCSKHCHLGSFRVLHAHLHFKGRQKHKCHKLPVTTWKSSRCVSLSPNRTEGFVLGCGLGGGDREWEMRDRWEAGRGNEPRGSWFIFRMEIKGLMVKHSSAGYFTGFCVFVSQDIIHASFT